MNASIDTMDNGREVTAMSAHALTSEMPWHTVKAWLAEQVTKAPSWPPVAMAMASVDVSLAMALAPALFGR